MPIGEKFAKQPKEKGAKGGIKVGESDRILGRNGRVEYGELELDLA